ncbi:MAG TPA: aromatic ring-hydroxylating dioxygenase subunit alpha [Candidatus Limnocylindrales bacterium]
MAIPDLRPPTDPIADRPHRHREPVWRPRPTLAGTDYTTQAVFDQERERIWFDGWVCVGRSSEIVAPGDYIVRDIVGESIVVNRDLAGRPRAFYNVCAHRGTQLVDPAPDCGHVNKVFKCPYHAWSYDLEGRLVGTPNVHEDEQFEREDHPLHAIAADEYGGFVFVSLAAEPQPLVVSLKASVETITDFDRYRMDELRLGARIVYEVKANWKTVVENYNECLHCPTVHPELVAVIPMYRSGEVWDGETRDGGNPMRDDATSFSVAGQSDLPRFPDLLPEDYGMYYGAFQFPNLMINLHPDSVMAYLLYPRGPGHTTVISEFYFRPETIEAPGFTPDSVVELWDIVSRQDWTVCERVQIGIGSRAYTSGVYPRKDRLVFDFNERWRTEMGRPRVG